MSLEDYMSSMVDELVDEGFDEFPNETISGYYRVEDDYIYIAEYENELEDTTRCMVYELSGNTLIIERIVEDGEETTDPMELEEFGVGMPWEFEKD